jgi:predicted ATPase
MKIKKISITDFRGIVGTLELDFTGPDGNPLNVVVLAGPNGSGKTSVLEACGSFYPIYNREATKQNSYNDIRKGKETAEIRITHCIDRKEHETEIKLFYNSEKPLSKTKYHMATPSLGSFGSMGRETIKKVAFFSSWRGPTLPNGVVIYANGDEQKETETEVNRLYNIINKIVRAKAKRSFENMDPLKKDEADIILGNIRKGWKYFYPERINDLFEAKTQGEDKFNVFLKKVDFNESLPVDALSSGELEIFIMLGWFAINDFKDGIIFIDEPELHLHPKWQAAIIPALRAILPETQFIIATHSPQVIGSVQSYEVKLLEQADNQAEGRNAMSPEATYGLNADRILEDVMDVPARPVKEIRDRLKMLFDEIDKNNLSKAKKILKELYKKETSDPELLKAEMLITRKELIGK